ncbi:MAG: hypothetical protein AMJ90_06115 [candidate division Zixibacteria bacterium SM23_73_2]|nr:MAG: hypothetical protein AMJ90_06115 [candidate division Zixibacteria bacterium SM23_73_2]
MSEPHPQKQEEKKAKCWTEKLWSERLDTVVWAVILIWGGLVLLAETTDLARNFDWWWSGWSVFFTGAGVIVLIEAVIRLFIPAQRKSMVWSFIIGFILLGIGLGSWNWIWPLALIAIGIIILISAFFPRR